VLMHAAAGGDAKRRLEAAKELLAKTSSTVDTERDQVALYLRAMTSLLRDVELLAVGGDPATLANADVAQELSRLKAYHGDRGLQAFQAVDRALVALDRNVNAKVVADWLLLQL